MPPLTPGLRARLATVADGHRPPAGVRPRSVRLLAGATSIRLDLVVLERHGRRAEAKPHLRFDRGAIAFLARLRARLSGLVPADGTLLVSVTAPIRQDSKTVLAVEARARTLLAAPSRSVGVTASFWGNQVRLRLERRLRGVAPVIGFVHNPERDARVLFEMTRSYLTVLAAGWRPARRGRAGRWLLVLTDEAPSQLAVYRDIASQCRAPAAPGRVLMRFRDGQIDALW